MDKHQIQNISKNLDANRIVSIIQKAFTGKAANPASTAKTSAALYNAIKHSVSCAMSNPFDQKPDWQVQILEPILDRFATNNKEDESVLLASVAVFLSYELFLQSGEKLSKENDEFVTGILVEGLANAEVAEAVEKVLEDEYERLQHGDLSILNAVWLLGAHIATAPEFIEGKSSIVPVADSESSSSISSAELSPQPMKTQESVESVAEASSSKVESSKSINPTTASSVQVVQHDSTTVTQVTAESSINYKLKHQCMGMLTGRPTLVPAAATEDKAPKAKTSVEDQSPVLEPCGPVHIQIFLKPNSTHLFEDITTVHSLNDTRSIHVSAATGLTMVVEEGVTVYSLPGTKDTVSIHRENASGFDLDATVIVPPGHSYLISEVVLKVEKNIELSKWTEIRTPKATFFVGNGKFELDVGETGTLVRVRNIGRM